MCILEVLGPQGSLGTSSETMETHTALLVELWAPHSPQPEKPVLSCLLSSSLPHCLWVTPEDPVTGKIPGFPEHLICSFCDYARRHSWVQTLPEQGTFHLRDKITPTIDSSCLSFCRTIDFHCLPRFPKNSYNTQMLPERNMENVSCGLAYLLYPIL